MVKVIKAYKAGTVLICYACSIWVRGIKDSHQLPGAAIAHGACCRRCDDVWTGLTWHAETGLDFMKEAVSAQEDKER